MTQAELLLASPGAIKVLVGRYYLQSELQASSKFASKQVRRKAVQQSPYLGHPGGAVQLKHAGGGGDVAEAVAANVIPSVHILAPDLEVEFGPPREASAHVMHV